MRTMARDADQTAFDRTRRPRESHASGLFVTCLVDLFRPPWASRQCVCLKMPAAPSKRPRSRPAAASRPSTAATAPMRARMALQVMDAFEPYDYVVAPSGSCGGMIAKHYPELFDDDPGLARRAQKFAAKTFELVSFLTDVLKVDARQRRVSATGDLSRLLFGPARDWAYASSHANLLRSVVRARPRGDARQRRVLRVRRHVRGQVRGDFRRDRRPQDAGHRGERRAGAACGRPRLPHEHGRPPVAPRPRDGSAPCRRSSRGHDGRAADRAGRSRRVESDGARTGGAT